MTQKPRILVLDIETSPALVYTWGLWNQNIGINQIVEPTRVICYAWFWYGEKHPVGFDAEWHHDTRASFIESLYDLWDQADAIAHWNGDSFDAPHIRREFLEASCPPPKPLQSIDLMRHVKKNYRFLSNKLDYVSSTLIGQHKMSHEGFGLWRKVLDGDHAARAKMARYNKRDVAVTTAVAKYLAPHIPSWPAHQHTLDGSGLVCKCGSARLEKRGFRFTETRAYQRYRCLDCGRWMSGLRSVAKTDLRGEG